MRIANDEYIKVMIRNRNLTYAENNFIRIKILKHVYGMLLVAFVLCWYGLSAPTLFSLHAHANRKQGVCFCAYIYDEQVIGLLHICIMISYVTRHRYLHTTLQNISKDYDRQYTTLAQKIKIYWHDKAIYIKQV